MSRLAIVLSHPTQYYSPWFRWLRANTAQEFRVFYLWDFGVTEQQDPQFDACFKWDVDLLSGYDHEFVPNVSSDPGTHHFNGLHNPTLGKRLRTWRPTAILLFGYAWRSHLGVILRPPAPLIFRGDSHLIGRTPSWLMRVTLRWLYSRFAAVTYVGLANRDYFRSFGVPEAKLHFAPHSVNAVHFNPDDAAARHTAEVLRNTLGLAGRRIVLYAGKFSEPKQPVRLLEAFLQVASPTDALVFVGDGAEKSRLIALAATHPDACVRFLPFANQSEMPARYLLADIFALPSRGRYETWGLAVNEAMHLGLPCLVSDHVGCQRDLVLPGQTGWVFPAENQAALATTLGAALRSSPTDVQRMATNARKLAASYTYQQASDGLLRAFAGVTAP